MAEVPGAAVEAVAEARWNSVHIEDDEAYWDEAKRLGMPSVKTALENARRDLEAALPAVEASIRERLLGDGLKAAATSLWHSGDEEWDGLSRALEAAFNAALSGGEKPERCVCGCGPWDECDCSDYQTALTQIAKGVGVTKAQRIALSALNPKEADRG